MHTYTAEFRIYGKKETLDMKAISQDLGLTPTNSRQRGDAKGSRRKFHVAMWGYEVSSGKEWDNLEDALKSLLQVLLPLKNKIAKHSSKCDVVLWCGHFTSSLDGGPTFSADLLQKLGELGVPLFLDTYYTSIKSKRSEK